MNSLTQIIFLIFSCYIYVTSAYYHTINVNNLKRLFDSGRPYSDLNNAYYSVKGLQLLGDNNGISNNADLCAFIKSKLDQNSLESLFFANGISNAVGNCQLEIQNVEQILGNGAESQNVADLYYYAHLSKSLNQQIDSTRLARSVLDGLKRDNSILNQAYSLHIATLLNSEDSLKFYNNIEDILEQADEFDQKYLQYEGGIVTTAFVLDGIFKLSEKHKKFVEKFDNERLTKFFNYIGSKRHVSNVKSGYHLLELALRLTNNQFAIPVVINRISSVSITNENPNVLVSVTNILNNPLKNIEFNIDASSDSNDESNTQKLFDGRKQLTPKSSDYSTFELNLFDSKKDANFYTIIINLTPKNNDKHLIILNKEFDVKFLLDVDLVNLEFGIADREQSVPKLTRLTVGQKSNDKYNADQTSKIYVRFGVRDRENGDVFEPNQAFVRFSDSNSGSEILFIAEQNAETKQYTCEVDLSTNAKNFNNQNGLYSVDLIVSDPLIKTPQIINLPNVNLKLNDGSISDTKESIYVPKPEIKHLFRTPEPTPSKLVSNLFSLLCILPTLLLIVLWFNIGVNVSKFEFSLSAIIFHATLAGTFLLFYFYWTCLNMFITLRYLSVLAIVLCLTGKQLLSALASRTKEKAN